MAEILETLHADLDIQCKFYFVLLDLTQCSRLSKPFKILLGSFVVCLSHRRVSLTALITALSLQELGLNF